MKKINFILSFFICNLLSIYADNNGLHKLECRAAAFLPLNKNITQIYGECGQSYQIEGARRWRSHRYMETWANLEWIFMKGEPSQICGSSDLDIINISFGVKASRKVYYNFLYVYAGIGVDIGIVVIENRMSCCTICGDEKDHSCNEGAGGIIKLGSLIFFNPRYYLDIFADYLYLPINFETTQDMGGFKIGAGLGMRF